MKKMEKFFLFFSLFLPPSPLLSCLFVCDIQNPFSSKLFVCNDENFLYFFQKVRKKTFQIHFEVIHLLLFATFESVILYYGFQAINGAWGANKTNDGTQKLDSRYVFSGNLSESNLVNS